MAEFYDQVLYLTSTHFIDEDQYFYPETSPAGVCSARLPGEQTAHETCP